MSDVATMSPLFVTQLAACTSIIGMGAYVESKSESAVEIEECVVDDTKLLGEGVYTLFYLYYTNSNEDFTLLSFQMHHYAMCLISEQICRSRHL